MNLQGLKTYVVALLMLIVGALPQVLAGTDWDAFMVNPKVGIGMIVSSVAMIVMRKLTTETTVKTALQTEPPKDGA